MSSVVDQAQTELYELIAAAPAFSDTLVRPGIPFDLTKKNERLYVSEDVVGWRRSRAASDYVEETFSIVLVIEVFGSGDHPGAAKARVCELVVAIDEMLEQLDFYGFGSEDGELEANIAVVGYDTGRLATGRISIPVAALS